jgi:putative glycosyltransferase (TIGR04372 family)
MSSRFFKYLVVLFGRPLLIIILVLAKSQITENWLLRGLGYLPFKIINIMIGIDGLRLIGYLSREEIRHPRLFSRIKVKLNSSFNKILILALNLSIKITRLFIKNDIFKVKINNNKNFKSHRISALSYLAFDKSIDYFRAKLSTKDYRSYLTKENIEPKNLYEFCKQLFTAGKLEYACETFEFLADNTLGKFPQEDQLSLLRYAGTTNFLLGKIVSANKYWARAGNLRREILGAESGPIYRIVGPAWFAAIGHTAMLDFYIKYNKLYRGDEVRAVVTNLISSIPGSYLCNRYREFGIEFISSKELHSDYNLWAKYNNKPDWHSLTPAYRSALIDDFWEFEFPDGEVLGYTHAANKIQKEWERQHRTPILTYTREEQKFNEKTLELLGVPKDAWYVCIHVREGGFHKNWNSLYPSMRDAVISDYFPSIDMIVKSGGWVIRMGDPSMKPLPSNIPYVVDYAHSELRNPKADILLTLGCRFFLGTNSGFATIPAIFGVKCVFSNWLPIGLPLWPSQDLMLPKLFWDEDRKRLLTFDEIFSTGLAFIQNWADLPKGITLRDNSPDELLELTIEALGSKEILAEKNQTDSDLNAYQQTTDKYLSYCGSRLANSFLKRYRELIFN